jgi:hypothetical protein
LKGGFGDDQGNSLGLREMQQTEEFAGKIKYYKVHQRLSRISGGKFDPDTLLTGCYYRLPITSIDIKEGTTSISDYSFYKCKDLSEVNIPKSVKEIGYCAFYSCSQLKSITIPDSVRLVDESAFENCSQLSCIALSDSLYEIDADAFKGCAIDSITIPKNVKYLHTSAFDYCKNLRSVIINEKTPCYLYVDHEALDDRTVFYVPKGCVEAYKSAKGWSEIKDRIFEIGDPAGKDYVSGINAVKTDRADGAAYDLQGRPVNVDRLQRGTIYIMDGKKIRK